MKTKTILEMLFLNRFSIPKLAFAKKCKKSALKASSYNHSLEISIVTIRLNCKTDHFAYNLDSTSNLNLLFTTQ